MSTGAAATDNYTIKHGVAVGSYGTTITGGIIGSTQTGQLISIGTGNLTKQARFFQLTISGGVFSNVGSTDHAAFWFFMGDTNE